MIVCFLKDIRETRILLKHGNHDQSTHGNRFRTINGNRVISQIGGKPGILQYDSHAKPIMTGPQLNFDNSKIEAIYEKKHPGVVFDLEGLHPEVAARACAQVSKLLDKYPETKNTLAYFGSGKKKMPSEFKASDDVPGTIGLCSARGIIGKVRCAITLNTNLSQTPQIISSMIEKQYKSGNIATDSLEGAVTHEFGHVKNYQMLHNSQGYSFLDFIGKNNQEGDISKATSLWQKYHEKDGNEVSDYAKKGGIKEQFPEGFAVIETGGAIDKPYLKSLKGLLEMEKGKYQKKPPVVPMNNELGKKVYELQEALKKELDFRQKIKPEDILPLNWDEEGIQIVD
jgi:hypothetical protein